MNGEASSTHLDPGSASTTEVKVTDPSINGVPAIATTSTIATRSSLWKRANPEKSMLTTATTTPTRDSKYTVQVVTKFMCRFCARQFDTPTEMQAHIATHSRGKSSSHSCYVCGKTYSTPSKLQRHVRVHSGERPYACNICGRRFTRSDHVKQHLKVHMPQKQRNVCRLCDMKFLRRQTLHSHLQQSHGVTTVFTCHRCGEAFDLITQLHTHKESHQSLYPSNDVTEGGVTIKREPGIADDDDNPVTGLAKFSLGPQPQMNDDKHDTTPHTGAVTTHLAIKDVKANGLADYQLSEDIAMESIIKDAISNAVHNEMELSSFRANAVKNEMESYREGDTTETATNDDGYNELESSTTVTDEMNMFILPSDLNKIKQEPKDSDELDESANRAETDLSKECQTMGNGEDDSDDSNETKDEGNDMDECSVSQTDEGGSNGVKTVRNNLLPRTIQEIRISPTGVKKNLKFKVLGPASYKAAMQQKLRAKLKSYVPISTIPIASSTPAITTMATGNAGSHLAQLVNSARTSWSSSLTSIGQGTLTNIAPRTMTSNIAPRTMTSIAPGTSTATVNNITPGTQVKKMMRCEHCCIWFEDYAMSLLHSSLHSADETDPFTCRKCLKKLGNRLEFTAHLVWHLEPTMDG